MRQFVKTFKRLSKKKRFLIKKQFDILILLLFKEISAFKGNFFENFYVW